MITTTMPGAMRIKETEISWRHLTVVSLELPNKHLLRRFVVLTVDGSGAAVTAALEYSTAAAADHAHQKMARAPATGTMPKEKTLIR